MGSSFLYRAPWNKGLWSPLLVLEVLLPTECLIPTRHELFATSHPVGLVTLAPIPAWQRMPALLGHSLLSSGISMLAESLLSNIRGHRDALGPGCKHVFQAVSTHIQVEILQAGPFMELSPMVERHQGFLEAAPQGPVSRNMPPLHLAPLTEPGWKSKTPKTGANLCHFAASLG